MPRTNVSFEMRRKSGRLRHLATRAEQLLWYELRDLKTHGLKFRRQVPIGPYFADFACFDPKVIVEVDGDLHETVAGKRHDANRDSYLSSLGYTVRRFDEPDLRDHPWYVAQKVKAEAERFRTDPTRPLRGHPPRKGEGEAAL